MTIKKYLFFGLAISVALSSCNKNNDNDDGGAGTDPFQSQFSTLSVEENKANIENEGIELANQMDNMMQSEAMDVSYNFVNMAENLFGSDESNTPMMAVKIAADMNSGDMDASDVVRRLKAVSEDPNSLSDLWNEVVGKHSYNHTTGDWDFTAGGDAIIIEFPGMEGETTNTAAYVVSNFTYVDIVEPAYEIETDSMDLQLPTSLNASLTYNGVELLGYTFTATYQTDGIPTYVKTTFSIEKFMFSIEINHTLNSALGATYAFTHDGNTLVELHADVSGNWSEESIEQNVIEHREFWYVDYYTGDSIYDEWTEPMVEKILAEANAHIQVMNLKIAGMVDVESLGAGVRALEEKYDEEENSEEMYIEMAALMNEHAQLVLVYADNGQKIAGAEAYVYEDEYGDFDLDLRFIFADESKTDAETYFDEGFEDLVDELNQIIAQLNTDYEAGIDPIQY